MCSNNYYVFLLQDDLPSVFEPEDGAVILKEALKRSKLKQQPPIYLETIVMSEEYFDKIIQFVRENLLHKNVESVSPQKLFVQMLISFEPPNQKSK